MLKGEIHAEKVATQELLRTQKDEMRELEYTLYVSNSVLALCAWLAISRLQSPHIGTTPVVVGSRPYQDPAPVPMLLHGIRWIVSPRCGRRVT